MLVGPNNAGKSNIIDALDFVGDVYRSGVKLAIERKGGFENIAYREDGIPVREMSFEVVVSADPGRLLTTPSTYPIPDGAREALDHASDPLMIKHHIVLRGEGTPLISEFTVTSELLEVSLKSGNRPLLLRIVRKGQDASLEQTSTSALRDFIFPFSTWSSSNDLLEEAVEAFASSRDLIVTFLEVMSPLLRDFTGHLQETKTYQMLPTSSRIPASPSPAARLGPRGENLPALVHYLKDLREPLWANGYVSPWARIMDGMASILPQLEDIEVQPTTDRLWRLVFVEAGVGNRWTADEVSDGTVRALALFASIFDPRYSLLAIEEPENSLHPWILREFIQACREETQRADARQVILTTHSPVLVDWLVPSEIAVVSKEQGKTLLKPLTSLEPGLESSWDKAEITLSSLLDSGLVLQSVPST